MFEFNVVAHELLVCHCCCAVYLVATVIIIVGRATEEWSNDRADNALNYCRANFEGSSLLTSMEGDLTDLLVNNT